jgi:hypothetical protein
MLIISDNTNKFTSIILIIEQKQYNIYQQSEIFQLMIIMISLLYENSYILI